MSENPLMTSFIVVLLNLNAHGSPRLKPDIYVQRNVIMVIGITVSMAQLAAHKTQDADGLKKMRVRCGHLDVNGKGAQRKDATVSPCRPTDRLGIKGVPRAIDTLPATALDALETEGLIRRAQDRQDSRASRVWITDEGRVVFDRIWPTIRRTSERMFVGIDTVERTAFLVTLQKILINLREDGL
jgi:hypothetical protein